MLHDFNCATEVTHDISRQVDECFDFQPWNETQHEKGNCVRQALKDAFKVIIQNVPPSADRTTALRKIREARMDCNSAITHNGAY